MTEELIRSASDEQTPSSDRTGTVLWSKDNGIGALVFNNASKHNAVSLDMWKETSRILEQFACDKDVRVVVLSGAGNKAFVSGADISKFESERASQEAVDNYTTVINGVYDMIYRFDKPIIAKIRGYCLGGGVGLAVSCDVRICSQNARFGIPATKLGNGYAYNNIKRLVDLVGPAFAKEIFLTGRQFGARESFEKGLISQVVSDEELDMFFQKYVEDIASNAPLSIKAARYAITQAIEDAANRDLMGCEDLNNRCTASQDYIEGRRAFMEKRKPRFTGT
jgi:enoyl-CoA hydratase